MALRPASLAGLSRRIMASRAVVPTRSGGGGPIALGKPASQPVLIHCSMVHTILLTAGRPSTCSYKNTTPHTLDLVVCMQLTEEDELIWDDGTANPEYCLDQFNLVGRVRSISSPCCSSHKEVLTLVCVFSGRLSACLQLALVSLDSLHLLHG